MYYTFVRETSCKCNIVLMFGSLFFFFFCFFSFVCFIPCSEHIYIYTPCILNITNYRTSMLSINFLWRLWLFGTHSPSTNPYPLVLRAAVFVSIELFHKLVHRLVFPFFSPLFIPYKSLSLRSLKTAQSGVN